MLARSERARINGIPRPRVRSPEFGSVIRHTPQSEIVTVNIASEEGQDIIEYGLLAAFISVVAWLTLQAIGQDVITMYSDVKSATTSAAS